MYIIPETGTETKITCSGTGTFKILRTKTEIFILIKYWNRTGIFKLNRFF